MADVYFIPVFCSCSNANNNLLALEQLNFVTNLHMEKYGFVIISGYAS